MEASLTPREFLEWAAYSRLEPIGGQRGDYHAAQIAATIANVNRPRGRRPYNISDFLMFDIRKRPAKGTKAAAQKMGNYLRNKAKKKV